MSEMRGSGLRVASSIRVLTQNGECRIDLCLGDITQLKKKDKVDVIVISAFRGDYTPTPTSVIGALQHNFGLSVEDLAKDKEEDLRKLNFCWWSKPLPKKLPYKRLLCFETKRLMDGSREELVANVYRCLVPILNNEDGSVITPLLQSQQGGDEVLMLKGIVEGAVSWMKAGLPLRLMKLVLYAKTDADGNLVQSALKNFQAVTEKFAELKERYEMQLLLPKAVPLEFDVYLSFSEEDEAVAKVIREKLSSTKDGIRIYDSSKQALNKEDVFQQDMYSVMMKSARVVTVLSPSYLQSRACIEQYNIALCCNRRALRDMLAPLYVDSVELMPTYMGLVQYVDCRPHDSNKINEACSHLSTSLSVSLHTELRVAEFDPLRYDVFLSYSHRDTEKANQFVETFQRLAPDLKLFFDVQELKAGKSWQRTLYHSIDGSRCMLALISKPYLESAVCQEEFALAQAKHYAKGKQHLQLIPICLEDLDSVQAEFTHIPMVKGTQDILEDTVQTICPAVVNWLKGTKVDITEALTTIFNEDQTISVSADEEMETFRTSCFQREFGTSDGLLNTDIPFPPSLSVKLLEPSTETETDTEAKNDESSVPEWDVVFSYHSDDEKYVTFMAEILSSNAPEVKVRMEASNRADNLDSLDRARCIVPILSPNYLESPECIEEFHVGIWRQRVAPLDLSLLLPICIQSLPQKPTYFHLVQYPVSLSDAFWGTLTSECHVKLSADLEEVRVGKGFQRADALALVMAIQRILQSYAGAKASEKQTHSPQPTLMNVMRLREQIRQISEPQYRADSKMTLLVLNPTDIPDEWREENAKIQEPLESDEEDEYKEDDSDSAFPNKKVSKSRSCSLL